jgi:hypothetical protein
MEDKLTVKTKGFGISMLPRPHFLQGFRVSKLSTAGLGWILYLDHTKPPIFNAQTTNQPNTSAKVTVKMQGSASNETPYFAMFSEAAPFPHEVLLVKKR